MKRFIMLILAAILLLSGCSGNTADSAAAMEMASSQKESIPEAVNPPEKELFVEDEAFYLQVLLTYGGELINGVLRPEAVSLYYISEGWQHPEELHPGSFYTWRLCQMWSEDITYEERVEKYKSPLGPDNGWFFEREEYEALVQSYFNISVEHLRSDPTYYSTELNGYTLSTGGGIGERPVIELEAVEKKDDLRLLHIVLKASSGNEHMVLTICIGADRKYKFVSYLPA